MVILFGKLHGWTLMELKYFIGCGDVWLQTRMIALLSRVYVSTRFKLLVGTCKNVVGSLTSLYIKWKNKFSYEVYYDNFTSTPTLEYEKLTTWNSSYWVLRVDHALSRSVDLFHEWLIGFLRLDPIIFTIFSLLMLDWQKSVIRVQFITSL